jgi:glycosyltransferase involved in cell wall biosynthesis
VTSRLLKHGHKIAIASNYGLEGTSFDYQGIKQFPRGFDMHSNDVVCAHMAAWGHTHPQLSPLLMTLYDVWIFKGKPYDSIESIASWVPIDHTPVPPNVAAWCAKPNVSPIAMSLFGKAMLERAEIECHYVPHAIEKVFKPTTDITTITGTMTGRQFMEIPEDKFVVGVVSANKGIVPCRKSFPELFLAFAMWSQKHDDAVLYLHTEDRGAMGGINLRELAEACNLPEEKIKFVDQYAFRSGVPNEVLAAVYTAMDVLLQPSMGEGFGIPAIEAQACGTPVIVSNTTASPELVGDGWLVEGQPWWDPMQKAWMVTPMVPSIIEALESAYQRGRERSLTAVEFTSQYDADYVFEKFWKPVIKALP